MLTISNPSNLRQILLCSIISQRPVVVQNINQFQNPSGLREQQTNFLKLIQIISNGCKVMVSKGGNFLKFYPGLITNNQSVEFDFDCLLSRNISYYLEYLILIALFSKNSLNIHLKGITNDQYDNSVDTIQQQIIPLLKNFYGFDNQLQMKILRRGYSPLGGGQIHIVCPSIKNLQKLILTQKGYIKRIRGVCCGSKIATNLLNQTVSKARQIFNNYIPDVWIFTDYYKGDKSSLSSGYSLSLVAQTTTGCLITSDASFQIGKAQQIGQTAALRLLDQIKYGGVISTNYQWLLLNLMAFSERKTSKAKLGRISSFTIECLRILKQFFGVIFEIQQSQSEGMAIFSVLGLGLQNIARIVK